MRPLTCPIIFLLSNWVCVETLAFVLRTAAPKELWLVVKIGVAYGTSMVLGHFHLELVVAL